MNRVVRTPAKVNLSLLVGPVAADGYHPLSTVFVPIGLYDELEFDLAVAPAAAFAQPDAPERRLEVRCPGIEQGANLVTRAVRAVESLTGWVVTGTIVVRKGIPVGAGLGGGSSDAAVVLNRVGEMVERAGGPRVEAVALARMARGLGADVPFFLAPRPALAAGVGDVLEALALPVVQLVLLLPVCPLSTGEVYRTFDAVSGGEPLERFEERRRRAESAWRGLAGPESAGGREPATVASAAVASAVAALLENDLERASFHLVPGLADLRVLLLRTGALGALMSGSGPTVFGVYASADAARCAVGGLVQSGRRAVAVETLA
ncbi:MAG: 4-(cytidine 5'-diphospho)-2-C-methyl-D-erythritol kinase [Thermoleophilia bacterium]